MKRRTVVRVREIPGGRDKYGDPIPSTVERTNIKDCLVAPRLSERTSGEIDDYGRAGVIVGLTLFAPLGADIVRTDRFDVDGVVYDVEGEPGAWDGDRVGGLQVALKRAEG